MLAGNQKLSDISPCFSILASFVKRPWSELDLSVGWKPTLDVIIEHTVLVAVFVEQAEGIGIGKVFKLDEAIYSKPVRRKKEEFMLASLGECPWQMARCMKE